MWMLHACKLRRESLEGALAVTRCRCGALAQHRRSASDRYAQEGFGVRRVQPHVSGVQPYEPR